MSILSPALLGAVGLVLLAAALGHLRSPRDLRRGLDAQDLLPGGLRGPVVVLLGPVEALLGVAALVVSVVEVPAGVTLAVGMPIAVLFLAFTVYLAQVLRVTNGRVVPCACGLGETPVSRSAVLRGGILTVLAVVGGVGAGPWALAQAPAQEIGVAVAAMLVLALATALMPAARAVPDAAIHHAGVPNHSQNVSTTVQTTRKIGGTR